MLKAKIGSEEASLHGLPCDFYIWYESRYVRGESSKWIKGRSQLYYSLRNCKDKKEFIKVCREVWNNNQK